MQYDHYCQYKRNTKDGTQNNRAAAVNGRGKKTVKDRKELLAIEDL